MHVLVPQARDQAAAVEVEHVARGAGGAGGGERDDAAPVDVDVHEGVTGDPCAREPHRRHGSGSAESREIVRKS
ncbi:hypothetical protein [Tsukamurella tyrosinosolvens]|uniref:hypothetical protein n=1 Tax=Tsukamurella tyrosinosolvens TaxID=57704 RepID=UPI001930EB9D|nr:hypothetical protein [Tsukamurella tyrosinosolvens]